MTDLLDTIQETRDGRKVSEHQLLLEHWLDLRAYFVKDSAVGRWCTRRVTRLSTQTVNHRLSSADTLSCLYSLTRVCPSFQLDSGLKWKKANKNE